MCGLTRTLPIGVACPALQRRDERPLVIDNAHKGDSAVDRRDGLPHRSKSFDTSMSYDCSDSLTGHDTVHKSTDASAVQKSPNSKVQTNMSKQLLRAIMVTICARNSILDESQHSSPWTRPTQSSWTHCDDARNTDRRLGFSFYYGQQAMTAKKRDTDCATRCNTCTAAVTTAPAAISRQDLCLQFR
nr:hypothetical protein CFP56_72712 [Quercus suber]